MGLKAKKVTVETGGPQFPEPLDYLWSWFIKHSMGLAITGTGYPTITWEGLDAWSRQMGIVLEPWEAELMVTLSTVRSNVYAERNK